jgi:hypothetical protein
MRRDYLISKYGDENVVRKILEKKIWQGMSREQLIDSWGEPADIDEKIYKTKVKYTYKYAQSGRNRFRQRVFVEDNIVVGWDSK